MSQTSTIYLPLNTYVSVKCFANAAFIQKVTITEENGTVHTAQGSGEHDTPLTDGTFGIQTPATSSSPAGYRITVAVQNQQGGTWVDSAVMSGGCNVMYYNLKMVVSEDYIDDDWNDAVAIFTWWQPPTSRNVVEANGK